MSVDELINLGIAREFIIIIISALPIFELRGAIPVAINIFQFSWYYALFLAIIGNMLPVPLILLFLDVFVKLLKKIKWTRRLVDWVFDSTWQKTGMIQRYKRVGLAIFVGIPLPFTGAWTGAIAATILGISFKRAFVSILIGVVIAGIIVTALSLMGWTGAIIAGVALCIGAIVGMWRW
jgi:uncharacterized membrane protein